MSYQEPAGSILAPTSSEERIEALDLLRGFAIVGMFAVHMTNLFWGDLLEEQGPTTLDEIIRIGGEVTSFSEAIIEQNYEELSSEDIAKICLNFEEPSTATSLVFPVLLLESLFQKP